MSYDSLHSSRRRALRPSTCALCRAPVIWARIKQPGRSGGRAFKPFAIEPCAPGTGDIGLSYRLFLDGEAPLAEIVSTGTGHRAHRCPDLPATSALPADATSPASFSAANFKAKRRRSP